MKMKTQSSIHKYIAQGLLGVPFQQFVKQCIKKKKRNADWIMIDRWKAIWSWFNSWVNIESDDYEPIIYFGFLVLTEH